MSVWDTYQNRIAVHGGTKRNTALLREQRYLNSKTRDSLSFHNVTIDGVARGVSIINSDNLNEKRICSLPGEDLDCGGLVEWAGNNWIITEKDANNEVYTRAKMIQCNYKLKWVDSDDIVREQWCVVEDGTKYMTGEMEDRNFIVTRGDSRVIMIISKNIHTDKFNRENRFILSDGASINKISFSLTKPLTVGNVYNKKGIYRFLLSETMTTEDDNLELGIADYYKHFDRTAYGFDVEDSPPEGKWL